MSYLDELLKDVTNPSVLHQARTLEENGWQAGYFEESIIDVPSMYFYVWDYATEWGWVCTIPEDKFATIRAIARNNPKLWPELRGALAYTVASDAQTYKTSGYPGEEDSVRLGLLLSLYASTTNSLTNALEAKLSPLHIIIMVYRANDADNGMLRPAIMTGTPRSVLPAETFLSSVEHIIEVDKTAHPEWFKDF
ncbi:histidine kinase [Novimethylophilus kurashikiensis]|uniref:Histidine kinase n=1 Tax=Novimethylophilus kurashikiensis TaxID=1825523 RepID=A0A2R5F8G3_9PROT|nr:hypothetical protein [Novimethylophilus kurashikiensis]GBG14487.1 histidine kinase [Novimethylophilus kurashikiensis]